MSPFVLPASFTLFGRTIIVETDPALSYKDDCVGCTRYRRNRIALQPPTEGVLIVQANMEETFFHELTHWILHMIQETTLDENETFVDLFAQCLHQALTTMTFLDPASLEEH